MVESPHTANIRSSGGPKAITAGRMMGIIRINTTIPNVDPSADDSAAQPSAVRARPWRAIGWPSISVAALGPDPGTLNRIAVTDPMNVAPPTNPPKVSTTGSGSQESVNGIASAISVAPLTPGRNATTIANSVPTTG